MVVRRLQELFVGPRDEQLSTFLYIFSWRENEKFAPRIVCESSTERSVSLSGFMRGDVDAASCPEDVETVWRETQRKSVRVCGDKGGGRARTRNNVVTMR